MSSNASSFEGSDRDDASAAGGGGGGCTTGGGGGGGGGGATEFLRVSSEPDQDGGNVKRMRLDAWVT